MSGFSNPIIGGMSNLVRKAIRSPNYVPSTTGWSINKDGSADFANLTLRGTFSGNNYVINNNGEFWYSGTPALGNLIFSNTNNAGTDSFGNAYLQGVTGYQIAPSPNQAVQINVGSLSWYQATGPGGPWSQTNTITLANPPSTNLIIAADLVVSTNLSVNQKVTGQQVPFSTFIQSLKTISTTTYTNNGNGMVLPQGAGGTYIIEGKIWWKPSGTIGGTHTHGFNFTGSVSNGVINAVCNQANSTGGINQSTASQSTINGAGNTDIVTSPTHLGFFGWTDIFGYMVCGPGTLQPVTKISTSGDTVDIYPGSFLRAIQVA